MQKLLTFFSKNISVYAIFNYQSFNDKLINEVVGFEQLGPVLFSWKKCLIWSRVVTVFSFVVCKFHSLLILNLQREREENADPDGELSSDTSIEEDSDPGSDDPESRLRDGITCNPS